MGVFEFIGFVAQSIGAFVIILGFIAFLVGGLIGLFGIIYFLGKGLFQIFWDLLTGDSSDVGGSASEKSGLVPDRSYLPDEPIRDPERGDFLWHKYDAAGKLIDCDARKSFGRTLDNPTPYRGPRPDPNSIANQCARARNAKH